MLSQMINFRTDVLILMASIPNLNTLRTSRGGPRRRRGDRNGTTNNGAVLDVRESTANTAADGIIQQTDNDASGSRMSAVVLGYLEDEFAEALFSSRQEATKRYVLINRGTYVRTTAIDKLVIRFLKSSPEERKQIFSLGAGSDTRFFRLWRYSSGGGYAKIDYHELDFEENVNQKRTTIRNNTTLSALVRDAEKEGWNYSLNALDLRDLIKKSPPIIPGLKEDLPTLLLSECCLCYLPPDTTASIIQYFSMQINSALALVLYEPIRPFDAFGKTMVSNLASRGIQLQTLRRYSSLQAERTRLQLAGFDSGQGARDIYQLWKSDDWVSPEERDRVERLEWLDEIEEWHLLSSHYCVAWGWRGEVFDEAWKGLDGSWTTEEANEDDVG